jgi:aspartyl protease family protein
MAEETRSLGAVAASFLAIFGVMYAVMDRFVERRSHPNSQVNVGASGPRRIELEPNAAGQYLVPGRVNGREVTFLVDTGATDVAIPAHLGERLDLAAGQAVTVETAGGRTRAARTEIDRIAVGGIQLEDVDGTLNPALSGDEILLGMSFLRHLDLRLEDDRLILEAAP